MKPVFIEPVATLEYTNQEMAMILPEATNIVDYTNYFREFEGYKILDNGNAEGKELGWEGLMNMANLFQVDEVVIPDSMGDSATSQEKAYKFGQWLKDEGFAYSYDFMGVAHGKTMGEVIQCIQAYAKLDYITVLGLPRLISNEIHKYARISLAESSDILQIAAEHFPGGIHCLGAFTFVKEAILLADLPVRSIDTSMVASMSLAGHDIGNSPYVPRQEAFWSLDYQDVGFTAEINHSKYAEWCYGQNAANDGF